MIADGLGRGVVVSDGAEAPAAWAGAPRVRIDEDVLADPAAVVPALHLAWLARQPVVLELALDPVELRQPEVVRSEPFAVGPGLELWRERLQFLVWTNNYDGRAGAPRWWLARKAVRLGARLDDRADVVLADGRAAWCDGGPRTPLTLGEPVVHRWTIELERLDAERFAEPSSELAPDQLAAVGHLGGAARVIAPAGSGKTRVLTERLRHLLGDRGYAGEQVLAVAYNKKAADEMVTRVGQPRAQIRTLNGLGLAIAGSSRVVIEEPAVRSIIERLTGVRPHRNLDVVAPYLEGLSAIRTGLVQPAQAERLFPDAAGLAELLPRFRALLADHGWIDFDGQIDEAVRLLMGDPERRALWQGRARHVLVDEFQDLRPAHLLLLRLLAAPSFDVFGVGDDDQTIYGYAHANPSFLIDYDRYFPGATTHRLEVNYRCAPAVVEGAVQLLSYNQRRIVKQVRARPNAHGRPSDLEVRRVAGDAMAPTALEQVQAWAAAGSDWSEQAVLARINAALVPVAVLLADASVPCRVLGDGGDLRRMVERTGVRTVLAYLRIGAHPDRIGIADVVETIHRPSRRIARNVVAILTGRRLTSLREIRGLAERLSGGDVSKLHGYADDLEAVAGAMGSTSEALRVIRSRVGLGSALDALDSSRTEADRSTHRDDLAALEQLTHLHEDAATFDGWLRDALSSTSRALADSAAGASAVTLATVHKVKGLEWPRVLVYAVDEGGFPHRLASDEEEERRVLHVAITRSSAQTVVLANKASPSPFLDELTGARPHPAAGARAGSRVRRGASGSRRDGAGPASGRPQLGAVLAGERQDPEVEERVERLRQWRREAAGRDKVPAYVVLHDAHLRGIAERNPASLEQLARCAGIGPQRLERHGDEILAALER